MKRMNRTKAKKVLRWAGFFVLCVGLTGETCLEERGVEVVVGASVTAPFEARGEQNVHHDTYVANLIENADVQQILEDNGFEDMVAAYIESAFYRVTKQDAGAADRMVSGYITVDGKNLIQYASIAVNDPTLADWTPVPLVEEGVDYINGLLADYFIEMFVNGNPNPPEPMVTFECGGTSEPQGTPTDFDWEIRVKLVLVGKTEVEVLDPL